jgi:hypothetical protein
MYLISALFLAALNEKENIKLTSDENKKTILQSDCAVAKLTPI